MVIELGKMRAIAEIAYMAAVLDSEGCLSIRARKTHRSWSYQAGVSVSQANYSWLEGFQLMWGGTVSPAFCKLPTHALKWQWGIGGQGMVTLLEAVRPYLKMKRAQADLLLELQRRIDHGPGRKGGQPIPNEELEVRRELYRKCCLLNRKGPRGNQFELPKPSPQLQLLKE